MILAKYTPILEPLTVILVMGHRTWHFKQENAFTINQNQRSRSARMGFHVGPEYAVFRDFIAMGTLAVQNAFLRSPVLETEYLDLARRYERDDVIRMSQLLGCLAGALECRHGDFLGSIFMELEIGSAHMGSFLRFTRYRG